jgi:hypothetical protein
MVSMASTTMSQAPAVADVVLTILTALEAVS